MKKLFSTLKDIYMKKKLNKILHYINAIQAFFFIIILVIFLILLLNPDLVVKALAQYLVTEDDLKPSDAIVILGGGGTNRIDYGIKLYNSDYGNEIVFSDYHEYTIAKQQFEENGITSNKYFIDMKAESTYENALYTKEIAIERGYSSIIVVAGETQTRRAKFIFNKVYKNADIDIIFCADENSVYEPELIFEDKYSREVFTQEVPKLFYYYFKYMFY
jgi:uncharacterized SAM-binding protein YcdF (DUF218 family)